MIRTHLNMFGTYAIGGQPMWPNVCSANVELLVDLSAKGAGS
jgi:hypothetical protein